MARKIKFRGWHTKEKYILEDIDFLDRDDFELMQFTGLYDKNDKEIYEGDMIIKSNKYEDLGLHIVEFANCLDWNYNGFILKNIKSGKYANFSQNNIWWSDDKPSNWDEVIGNIYENPELLEEK